jgi:hypothetical protein
MKTLKVALAVMTCSSLCACARPWSTAEVARGRAAEDLDCPRDQIAIEQQEEPKTSSYLAIGCGKKAEYFCEMKSKKARIGSGEVNYQMECQQQDQ